MQEYEETLFNPPRISQDPVFVFQGQVNEIKRQIKDCKDLAQQQEAFGLFASAKELWKVISKLEKQRDSLFTPSDMTLSIPYRGGYHGY